MANERATSQLIKRILVATDGSREALDAASYAAELARSFGADVTLLHVVEMVPTRPPFITGIDPEQLRQEFLEGGRAVLALTRRPLVEAGVPVETELREGRPGNEIVDMAAGGKYDVIVIGNRGLGLAQRLLLGSVSDHVVRHAPCPVVIVRGEWTGRPLEEQDKQARVTRPDR